MVKFRKVYERGSFVDKVKVKDLTCKNQTLIGESNEVKVQNNDIDTHALLDQGSIVTTVSRHFYD